MVECNLREEKGETNIIMMAQSLEALYRRNPLIHDGSSSNVLQVPFAIGSVLSSCSMVFHFLSLNGRAFCFSEGLVL